MKRDVEKLKKMKSVKWYFTSPMEMYEEVTLLLSHGFFMQLHGVLEKLKFSRFRFLDGKIWREVLDTLLNLEI